MFDEIRRAYRVGRQCSCEFRKRVAFQRAFQLKYVIRMGLLLKQANWRVTFSFLRPALLIIGILASLMPFDYFNNLIF